MSNAGHLPAGWITTPFTSLLDTKSGNSKLIKGTLHSSPKKELFIGFSASGQDVWLDHYEHEGEAIIVSAVGARCGKAFRASGQWSAIANTHIVKPFPGACEIDYLFRFINREDFWTKGGSAQPFVKVNATFEQNLPLPPLAEQTRIAAKLDELLAQVDILKARIDTIPALLKRFRQSVLAGAVSGRLTEKWRENIKAKDWESVSWGEILKNNRDAFKRGPFGSALKKSMFVEHGYKVYEQYCPINDDCSFSRYYITPEKYEEMRAFSVDPGDFLISCSGVSLGRITQVPAGSEPGIINQALLRVRLNESIYSDEFFKVVFRSPTFQKDLFENSTGSAIPNLKGVKELKAMPVPLPSLEEQTEIVRRVEQLLAFADQLETKVTSAKSRIDQLTQSILAKAFRGELVPQDPSDEPASVLLERIKAQRAAAPKAKRGRKASV